jgi:hypothetical protein
MPKYVRTELIEVKLFVDAENLDAAESIGNDFIDALLFDDKTLRKRAKELDTAECRYLGADSTGDSEISLYKPERD